MKVFISWSGNRGKAIAKAVYKMLPAMLHPIVCWMSEEDLPKGKPWFEELRKEMDNILYGIFCVTPENQEAQWMQWEAGFLSSSTTLGDRRVAPLVSGIPKGSLSGPLAIYQATEPTAEDMLRLIKNINRALGERSIAEMSIDTTFESLWPRLNDMFVEALKLPVTVPMPQVSTPARLEEILALLRDNQRQIADAKLGIDMLNLHTQVLIPGVSPLASSSAAPGYGNIGSAFGHGTVMTPPSGGLMMGNPSSLTTSTLPAEKK